MARASVSSPGKLGHSFLANAGWHSFGYCWCLQSETSRLTLDTAKVLMRFSSSSMLPWLADSICRMVSSSRLSSAFMCALFTIRLDFISDKSGRSCSKRLQAEAALTDQHQHWEQGIEPWQCCAYTLFPLFLFLLVPEQVAVLCWVVSLLALNVLPGVRWRQGRGEMSICMAQQFGGMST